MADIVVALGDVSSGRFVLTANEVSTVTFTENIGAVQIITDGGAAVYYTVDGRDPVVDGPQTFEIPAAAGLASNDTANTPGAGDVVKLVSTGTPSVRVERA